MSLTKRLENLRKASAKKFDESTRKTMHDATEALRASGQAERSLGEGASMPGFALPDSRGETVTSASLLDDGPLVLTFFRGHW